MGLIHPTKGNPRVTCSIHGNAGWRKKNILHNIKESSHGRFSLSSEGESGFPGCMFCRAVSRSSLGLAPILIASCSMWMPLLVLPGSIKRSTSHETAIILQTENMKIDSRNTSRMLKPGMCNVHKGKVGAVGSRHIEVCFCLVDILNPDK